ncbi:hypothetical protein DFJ77DRAFT_482199 [Powellomyces hirtus]|nr:hypothetical protein DFJ77DRAFT_482199 [Powellomyces hirtus]
MLWAHGLKLEEGYNQKLRGATITHNDVEAYHKPLVLYALVSMLERSAHVLLLILGFRRHRASGQDALKGITYWLRHPKTSTALPLVFIHGLGGGLWCYIKFIGKLWYAQRHRPIYIIELPHVSYRLEKDAPEAGAFVGAVNSMLDNHGHRKAFFVGHSLGTAYQSFMNKHTTRVAGNVFIDPICFKIYDISLLYNFVHRRPGADGTEPRANEFLVHWLVAKELFVSQWISRHFIWHRVHLLPSSLLAPTHVFISEHDNLIDAPVVSQYLKECNVNHSMHKQADHAQFMLDDRKEWEILGKIGEMLDSAGREWSRKEKTGRRRRHLQGLDWM